MRSPANESARENIRLLISSDLHSLSPLPLPSRSSPLPQAASRAILNAQVEVLNKMGDIPAQAGA